jgi:tRNA (guanine-N7-)-methyltransferase
MKLQKLSSLRMQWPTDWTALFGAERPLILEIGFGYGQFLFHLARLNPDANIIGLEIAGQCLRSVEGAIERQRVENIRVIQSTAETALHHLFTPASLTQIHINFPDPWFKKRHSHRRLMQRDTLDAMVSRLQAGGLLYLATDIIEYAEMSAELLAETPGLDNLQASAWTNHLPGRTITKYEARAQREGRGCYYFACRRNEIPAPDVPVLKEEGMTHIVFKSPLTVDEMLAAFDPLERGYGDSHVSVLQAYKGRSTLLFEVYIKEPTIDQHIALVLSKREHEGEYTLKTGSLGYPRVTPGLHKAVSLVGNWLVSLHPEAEILNHKLKAEN